jgi:hypothetical protein
MTISLKRTILLLLISLQQVCTIPTMAQTSHPHILVSPADKPIILEKIEKQAWAKSFYDEIEKKVTPYVERHKTNPEWILSRYLMNRIPGKRYINFLSDAEGTAMVSYAGDAPYPTVRVAPHKRSPTTPDGYGYKLPTIEELVPYDTSMLMLLQSNAPNGKKEWVNPQSFVDAINTNINELALHAAIIYWLTGKTEYATFAGDILSQWARGASYQFPITGPCRTGFLSMQTLGDASYASMPLVYDFLYDFLHQHQYNTSYYETVFDKMAHTMTFRGFWNNNWFAAQTPTLVYAALSLENKQKRDYYLDFYLTKDTINGSCGHLGLPSVVKEWLTPDGHWKEPGGYHNFPVSSLLTSAVAMEKNGYEIFNKHPALFGSAMVMLKYSFPNLMGSSLGDTGPVMQSAKCLEIGLLMAKKYANPVFNQLAVSMQLMLDNNLYKRSATDYFGLLCNLSEIPKVITNTYSWPRSGTLDFAKLYLQRNGEDKKTGLMYVVQGATYNHNHANGMSMELYGLGNVMGPDPGKGINYEAPMHVKYYAQWAAHNTVVAAGSSASTPYFKGGGGTKNIGEIKLAAMEPMADTKAVSELCSFTDTRYFDKSTKTNQQRTLALIRTSSNSGYYVDIYRSDNAKSNDYLYHNIGNDVAFFDEERTPISTSASALPIRKKPYDPPGLSAITDIQSTGKTNNNVIALFQVDDKKEQSNYMQVLFAGVKNREFFKGLAPATLTADIPFRELKTPTIISHQNGEAASKPFVAVYEPFAGKDQYTVKKIQTNTDINPRKFTHLEVISTNYNKQIILQSADNQSFYKNNNWAFKGSFGVISVANNNIEYLYLGEGNELAYGNYKLSIEGEKGSANLSFNAGEITIHCNQETTLFIANTEAKSAFYTTNGVKQPLEVITKDGGIAIKIPAKKLIRNLELGTIY